MLGDAMKQIKLLFLIVIAFVLFPAKAMATGDSAALIPYLAEQVANQAKQIGEMVKQTQQLMQQVNSVKELASFKRSLMEGLDQFTGNFQFADTILDAYETYDDLSYDVLEIQEQYDLLFEDERDIFHDSMDSKQFLNEYRIKRQLDKVALVRAEATKQQGNRNVDQFNAWIKSARQAGEKGAYKMMVEGLGHLGQLLNTLVQNDATQMTQKTIEGAIEEKEKNNEDLAGAAQTASGVFPANELPDRFMLEKPRFKADRNKKPK